LDKRRGEVNPEALEQQIAFDTVIMKNLGATNEEIYKYRKTARETFAQSVKDDPMVVAYLERAVFDQDPNGPELIKKYAQQGVITPKTAEEYRQKYITEVSRGDNAPQLKAYLNDLKRNYYPAALYDTAVIASMGSKSPTIKNDHVLHKQTIADTARLIEERAAVVGLPAAIAEHKNNMAGVPKARLSYFLPVDMPIEERTSLAAALDADSFSIIMPKKGARPLTQDSTDAQLADFGISREVLIGPTTAENISQRLNLMILSNANAIKTGVSPKYSSEQIRAVHKIMEKLKQGQAVQ